jgi:hypothetical protein
MPRTLILLSSLAALAGCSQPEPDEPEQRAHPEGTILVVDDQPILAADVDRFVDAVALIEPEFVLRDHRRKVISNISIPLAAGAALDPAGRDEAFSRAQALLSAFRETGEVPADAPKPQVLSGTFKEVGLISWALATEMEPLTISELHETPGAWSFFKLTASTEAPGEFEGRSQVTILRYDVPYLPPDAVRGLVQTAMQGFEIEIVDPAWEPMVPPAYLYPSESPR